MSITKAARCLQSAESIEMIEFITVGKTHSKELGCRLMKAINTSLTDSELDGLACDLNDAIAPVLNRFITKLTDEAQECLAEHAGSNNQSAEQTS
ncbi:hypothetical protein ACMFWY_22150 [Roseiconus sp. JC912]